MECKKDERRKKTVSAHNEWLDLIYGLYRSIQINRADMKQKAKDHSLNVDKKMEERLIKQQKLIRNSWKID